MIICVRVRQKTHTLQRTGVPNPLGAMRESWPADTRCCKRVVFQEDSNVLIVERLQASGLQFELDQESLSNASNKLDGKSFVVSGVFSQMSRNEIKKAIEDNGGRNVGSISKKTDYVLAGENMGPSKLKKAETLEIPIISEEDFIGMIK